MKYDPTLLDQFPAALKQELHSVIAQHYRTTGKNPDALFVHPRELPPFLRDGEEWTFCGIPLRTTTAWGTDTIATIATIATHQ